MSVVEPGVSTDRRADAEDGVEEAAAGLEAAGETRILQGTSVVDRLVAETGGLPQELVFRAVPEAVGQRAQSTVVVASRHGGIFSRFRRGSRWT